MRNIFFKYLTLILSYTKLYCVILIFELFKNVHATSTDQTNLKAK